MKSALFLALGLSILTSFAHAQSGPPALCKPCLFYGGDLNPNDPSAEAFTDEETITTSAATYGELTVPANRTIQIEGVLFQIVIASGDRLDPKGASWEVRTNITEEGGTVVSGGGGSVQMQPTGREFNGNAEYTIAVRVDPPLQLSGGTPRGTDYWFNLTPVCLNQNDLECSTVTYMVSNTTQQTNSVHAFFQKPAQVVFVWPKSDFFYSYCYEDGYNGQQCGDLSFGLMGSVVQ